ncbi:putative Ig domain-containing protein [Catenovulum sediminis]|uniref:putative Ig domain-containing protein n=1 Tax=Catenovulum sediminis TaxID=1740262 RepID=UPI00118046EB|nr:putative Ig domain-containing protein [Catenovulum sediminis]
MHYNKLSKMFYAVTLGISVTACSLEINDESEDEGGAQNTPPVITSASGSYSVDVGTEFSYTMTAMDADNDNLMKSVLIPAELSWLTFDDSTGVLSGTPGTGDVYTGTVTLIVDDGLVETTRQIDISVVQEDTAAMPALVVFENQVLSQWAAWDCCTDSTPELITDDIQHDQVVKFSILGDTVMGFTARDADGAVNGTPYDASNLQNAIVSFELKMNAEPTAGVVPWKFKVESSGGATPVELDLSASVEGHTSPVLDTWQTYTFKMDDLKAAGLDVSAIDVFMIFPAWGSGAGQSIVLII